MPRRLGLPALVFVMSMVLLALAGLHRPLDYAVFGAQFLDRPDDVVLSDDIRLIDVPYPESMKERGDPTLYRARLADLLSTLGADTANLPRAVILDVWFSKDDRGLAPLLEALARLKHAKVATYASFNPDAEGKRDFDALMREHARALYEDGLTGYGHTRLSLYQGILSYERELEFPTAAGTRLVRSLPTIVARDLQWPVELTSNALVVPIGNERSVDERTVTFAHKGEAATGGRLSASAELRGAVVVVGSIAEDKHALAPQAGPKLVAWALDDARRGHRNARVPLNHGGLILGVILALALMTALAIALLFKLIPRLQTRPGILAAAGTSCGLSGLAALSGACLLLGYVLPIGLPLFAILITGTLGWRYAVKFLASGAAEGSGAYDVFISYSRKHGDWVAANLFGPLSAMRKPDGQPLRIFFDRSEIGIGEAFTSKYMWAIVESRVFVPVFSADYYGKNHCRNEMDLAYKRHVDKRLRIAPIAIEPDAVPEIFAVLNYIDARIHPSFVDDIARIVVEHAKEAAS